jgi:hypothetical protein
MIAVVFLCAAGLVTAGLVESLWAMATGERLRFELAGTRGMGGALKVLALVLASPLLFGELALRTLNGRDGRPLVGLLAIAGAAFWCLVQGVVIVSAVQLLAHGAG